MQLLQGPLLLLELGDVVFTEGEVPRQGAGLVIQGLETGREGEGSLKWEMASVGRREGAQLDGTLGSSESWELSTPRARPSPPKAECQGWRGAGRTSSPALFCSNMALRHQQ